MTNEIYDALTTGPQHSFRDLLHETLPLACIGVCTIERGTEFVYVGIAGRNLDLTAEHKKAIGVSKGVTEVPDACYNKGE